MSDRVSFLVLATPVGPPLTGVTPTFVTYKSKTGASLTPPTIFPIGFGIYAFTATDSDVAAGAAYLIATSGFPSYVFGAVHSEASPFAALLFQDASGVLWAGAEPSIPAGGYMTYEGVPRAVVPSLLALNGVNLYALVPSESDLRVGTVYRVDGPSGSAQSYYAGGFSVAYGSTGAAPETPDPWFAVNGIELAGITAIASAPTTEGRDVGAQDEAADGSLILTRQARKRDFSFTSRPIAGDDARSWAGLLTGEGHVWSFDAGHYSSKGVTGAGGTVQSTVKKYGAKALQVSAADVWLSNPIENEGEWTLAVWHRVDSGAFKHEVVRSDGARWVDGVRDDAYTVDGAADFSDDCVVLENASGTHYYDDLVFSPYLWLEDWAEQVYASGLPFGPAPFLTASGRLVPEAESRRMACVRCDERILVGTLEDERHHDLRELSVELRGA